MTKAFKKLISWTTLAYLLLASSFIFHQHYHLEKISGLTQNTGLTILFLLLFKI